MHWISQHREGEKRNTNSSFKVCVSTRSRNVNFFFKKEGRVSNTGNDAIAKKGSGKMDLPYPEHHQKKEARASRNKIHAVSRPLLKASLPLQDIYLFLPAFDGRVTHFIYQRQRGENGGGALAKAFSLPPFSYQISRAERGEKGRWMGRGGSCARGGGETREMA